jgi:SPP1 gp7 family putative phage head morphogenesis protein
VSETVAAVRAEWRAEGRAQARGAGFHHTQRAETTYARQLRSLARQIADIIEAFAPHQPDDPWEPGELHRLEAALDAYAKASEPWAARTAWRMLHEVERRDKQAWRSYSEGMSEGLRREIASFPTGETMQRLLGEQVSLITSLPREASQRVHALTLQALSTGVRAPVRRTIRWTPRGIMRAREAEPFGGIEAMLRENPSESFQRAMERVAPENMQEFLLNRATLIARTEAARSASVLVQARSEYIGADHYVWTTAGDWNVRPSHKKLNGSVHTWAKPPLCDPPDHHAHPGQIFNCRCVALPVL